MRILRIVALIAVMALACAAFILAGNYLRYNQETLTLDDAARKDVPGSFVRLPDGVVHYELAGPADARTVVLVHGFSVPYYLWDPTFAALKDAGFRVLRYDLYGRGYSDRPDVKYGPDLYDRELVGLLDALKIKGEIDLVGVSLGGPMVTTFAARHPDRVHTITLEAPGYSKGVTLPAPIRWPILGEYTFATVIAPGLAESQANDLEHPEKHPEYVEKFRPQMQYKGFRRALLSTLRDYLTVDNSASFEALGKSGVPVLLLWGKQDKEVSFETSNDVRNAIPQAEFHAFVDMGHVPHYEIPEQVNPILLEFLRKHYIVFQR